MIEEKWCKHHVQLLSIGLIDLKLRLKKLIEISTFNFNIVFSTCQEDGTDLKLTLQDLNYTERYFNISVS